MRYFWLCLMILPLVSCQGTEERPERPIQYRDGNAGVDVAAVEASQEAAHRSEQALHQKDANLGFAKGLFIEPATPTVEDSLVAVAPLVAGVDSFAEVSYSWYVNGRRVSGVTRDRLKPGAGGFQRGDTVYFSARVENVDGQYIEESSKVVEIGNAKPIMLSDVRQARGLHGVRLKAEDPDGDELTWSVEGGPPGVSIDARGRIRVKQVNLQEKFSGEVVFVAEDPEGARAELHIPVSVNAATEARVEEREVTRVKRREEATEAEFEKANLEAGDRIEKMSPEEFERYIREQERRAK
tara:strand:+ start:134 stop:1024 length:891 start_codon:yes stop_codon:yes gene_type:complete